MTFANKKILAVIPARSGSKGLPGKNVMQISGKPLIAWSIEEAKRSKYLDKVIVSTDSSEFGEIAEMHGAEVPFLRPTKLSTDEASSFSVIEHAIGFLMSQGENFDYIVLLEPTSPLREHGDIDGAIEKLLTSNSAKSIVGISKVECQHPAFVVSKDTGGFIKNYSKNHKIENLRRQEIEQAYFLEGSIFRGFHPA